MSSTATRGALLVAVAALLGFLVLRGSADNSQFPVANSPVVAATPTVDVQVTPDDGVPIAEPTPLVDARDNSQVRVLVANGTEVSGQASRLTDALRNQGFVTREPRNADPQTTSTIFYRPGFAAEATVVRNVLGASAPIAPMPNDPFIGENIDLSLVDVLVLVGADELATS